MGADPAVVHAPIASSTGGAPVAPLSIVFDTPVPGFDNYAPESEFLLAARGWYRAQAFAVVSAMEKTCPGGFMDALLGALLDRKATVFRVPDVLLAAEVQP